MNWSTLIKRDIPFAELEQTQADLIARAKADPDAAFLLVSEPRPTFTHGRFASPADCLWSPEKLQSEGVQKFPVTRGGKWTFHGPGQIVIYPILTLKRLGYPRHGVHRFLTTLRASLAEGIRAHGVPCETRAKPFGLYAGNRKLVSFGISLEGGISSHGLALYHGNQSHFFAGIRPCGMEGEEITSLAELGLRLGWQETAQSMTEWIKKGFTTA